MQLRQYLTQGISKVLEDNLLDDETRSHAAIALARVGNADELPILCDLIQADVRRGRGSANSTINSASRFVQALLMLDAPGTDARLIDLLNEQRYEDLAARGLVQLTSPRKPNELRQFDRTNFDAIWASRGGKQPGSVSVARAKVYANAVKARIEALKHESATVAPPQNREVRLKALAIILASLDARDSANVVIEVLERPAQWDQYARMRGMRVLLTAGSILSLDRMLAVLDSVIEHSLSEGPYNDSSLTLLVDALELLLFSDDPGKAVQRIEAVMSRFKYRPYQFRDLIVAMGHTRSPAVVPFLSNLANNQAGLKDIETPWIEALGRLDVPTARNVLLSIVDPQLPRPGEPLEFDYQNTKILAAFVGKWAREDNHLRQRLVALSGRASTPFHRRLLLAIYNELGSGAAMITGVNMI